MKRNFIVTLTLVALSLLTVSTSFAQDKIRANVPFAFQVGKTTLPAGTYIIGDVANSVIRIGNSAGHAAVMSSYLTEEKLRPENPKMVFHKYGNTYFLAEIWDGSGRNGMQLPEAKREKELRASSESLASEEFIVVAMK